MKILKITLLLTALLLNMTLKANNSLGFTEVKLTCSFVNCSSTDSLTLYRFAGTGLEKLQSVYADASQVFTFKVAANNSPMFYFVGTNLDETRIKPIWLGTEEFVMLSGPCFDPRSAAVMNSPVNTAYEDAIKKVNQMKIDMGKVITEYRNNQNNPALIKEIEGKMGIIDQQKIDYLNGLRKTNPWLARIVALDTYTSFQNSPNASKYKDEIEYFAKNYFQYADFKDSGYDEIPVIFDMFKSYSDVMCLLGLTDEVQYQYLSDMLKKIPFEGKAYQMALSGLTLGLMNKANLNFVKFGNEYIEKYQRKDILGCARISQQINTVKATMIGIEAPEIVMNTPDNAEIKLSNLRGKLVLVDFWASWCGPCRRENPYVVALYNKYKDRGFDVYSVSLDGDAERWKQAIEADGLIWKNHVSDLKKWQNAAAQLYSVTSIPHTVLVGKDGKIIARNLRGEDLGNKVREILGE